MPLDFIHKNALLYKDASADLLPWYAFACDTVRLFRELNCPILIDDNASTYLSAVDISKAIKAGDPLKVWRGGEFSPSHPMNQKDPVTGFKIHVLARAVHDILVHDQAGMTFELLGELNGALHSRKHYSVLAQPALWTDDVAMGAHYAHFGEWPKVQWPVIVQPDWEGLEEFLKDRKGGG